MHSIVTEKWDARPEHILVGLGFSLLGQAILLSSVVRFHSQLYWKVL